MGNHNFKELRIWLLAMEIIDDIYPVTREFPIEEKYGLAAQMRRSAVSIASNIAEGCGRGTNPQLVHFLCVAQGSAYELETQVYIANRQNFCSFERLNEIAIKINELQKMIDGFRNKFI